MDQFGMTNLLDSLRERIAEIDSLEQDPCEYCAGTGEVAEPYGTKEHPVTCPECEGKKSKWETFSEAHKIRLITERAVLQKQQAQVEVIVKALQEKEVEYKQCFEKETIPDLKANYQGRYLTYSHAAHLLGTIKETQ